MKKKLLSKEDILSFRMWDGYFNFLISIKALFEKELAAKLSGEKINSFIDSEFYEQSGEPKKGGSKEYPDSEEIHFEVENRKYSAGFSFYDGDTLKSCLDLYFLQEEEEQKYTSIRFLYGCKTEELFSPEVIDAAVYWIKTGELHDFIKEDIEVCNED